MPFEIDLNEAPPEGSSTCGTCGGERGNDLECLGCMLSGGGGRRKRLPDINAPPPDAYVAAARPKMCSRSDLLGRSGTAPITSANFLNLGRGLNLSNASCGVMQIPHLITENVDPLLKRVPWPPTNLNSALQSQSEVYLRALREYINQRRGFLSEGWSVDFFYCQIRCKTSAVYCAPDGSRFVSMDDVARHLGLKEQHSLKTENSNDSFALLQRRLLAPQAGMQSLKFSRGNSFRENQDRGSASSQDPFPFQFEDLFILSVGLIDARHTYHNTSQIWPVGYKSCWHEKISGSIFVSEVLEGGDAGPIFRVRRHSCSALPIPVGSTVLSRKNRKPCNWKEKVSNNDSNNSNRMDDGDNDDEILSIQMMMKEHIFPNLGEMDFQKTSSLNTESGSGKTVPGEFGDCIGEFSVESRSSLLAWEMASRALLHACHMAYKQTGRIQLRCKHDIDRVGADEESILDPLSRFCSWSSPIDKIPQLIVNDNDFEACGKLLMKWLQQDRFGLDMEFVQEIMEQLPNVHACSGYIFMNKRGQSSGLQTVESGFLFSKRKGDTLDAQEPDGFSLSRKRHLELLEASAPRKSFPLGKPFSKLPPSLVGDVLQGWEFLWRFSEILGLEEPFLLEAIENELVHPWVGTIKSAEGSGSVLLNWDITSCTGVTLRKAHSSLLKSIVSELVAKVAAYVDPFSVAGESKSRRGKKKETESSFVKKMNFDMLHINELTWPELARRYILVILSLESNLDSVEINSSVGSKIFHCLQGDGGILSGSLTGVAGMEADALLLAEARKHVFGSPKNNEVFSIDQPKPEEMSTPRFIEMDDSELPEWAQALEPVRKLPTNVGARLKKCVIHALELNPPEWAKTILEHSISREVYKGNASGPTKRAVVSILSEISSKGISSKGISVKSIPSKGLLAKPLKRETSEGVKTFSDLLMKQCRIVLRRAAAEDDEKVFCNLLGKTLYPYDNDDEGLMGSSATVSRPLDFRVIDFRLAAGAYSGSHEAFYEDVCEMWNNIRSIYSDRSDLVEMVEKLSQRFKDMYEEEVVLLMQKLPENFDSLSITDEAKRDIDSPLVKMMESSLPKAPWEDGICKVCGVDKDDDNVLLCDGCDSEYHTYCLNPPLARIPDGNWYCPSCVSGRYKSRGSSRGAQVTRFKKKKIRGEFTQQLMETLSQLAQSMGSKEYWNFNAEERTFLFKFLCDEALNTNTLRNHLENCTSVSVDLQQNFHSLSSHWKTLKVREEALASIMRKSNITNGESAPDGPAQEHSADGKSVKQQLDDGSINESSFSEKPHSSPPKSNLISYTSHAGKRKQRRKVPNTSDRVQEEQQAKKQCQDELPNTIDDQGHGSSTKSRTYMAENNNGDASILQANHSDVTSLKHEILAIQESISCVESELDKMSIRKEFLGRDSAGRVYWGFRRPGTCSLLVDRSLEDPYESYFGRSSQVGLDYHLAYRIPTSGWISYHSDGEISEIVEWLSYGEARERELRDSILQWQRSKSKNKNITPNENESSCLKLPTAPSCFLVPKATSILEKKYGPCLEWDPTDTLKSQGQKGKLPSEGRMYRCDCLELIWSSKHHCFVCHKTCSTSEELERHYDGNCSNRVNEESRKGKNIVLESEPLTMKRPDEKRTGKPLKEKNKVSSTKSKFQEPDCPHDFKEISSKFVTQNSLRELARGIGLIGFNGNPSLLPRSSVYDDTTLSLASISEDKLSNGTESKVSDNMPLQLGERASNSYNFLRSLGNDRREGASKVVGLVSNHSDERDHFQIRRHRSLAGGDSRCVIPESSLRQIISREFAILRQLQMNLLDMVDALPEEAVRLSMSKPDNRIAWRAFVKAAGSIYEMVQATIVLENMIRGDYLTKEWWYWSSLTAAANISTLSALALRICTLESAILYEKPSPASATTELSGSNNKEIELTLPKSDKGKEKVSPSKPSHSPQPKGRNNKRRKDSGN